jgi:two-component system, chemotaxis family, chemotaxis protein CheY
MSTTESLGINPKTLKPFTVMIVDDSRSMRMYLKQFLTSEKFEIIFEASDGNEAVKAITTFELKPDIIFVDVEMPEKDGIQTVKEIRPLLPKSKIIMETGNTDPEIVKQLLSLKIDGYIVKPYDRKVLKDKIESIINRQ